MGRSFVEPAVSLIDSPIHTYVGKAPNPLSCTIFPAIFAQNRMKKYNTIQTQTMTDVISRLIFSLPPLARLVLVLTGSVLIHLTIGTYHTFGKYFFTFSVSVNILPFFTENWLL